MTESISPVEIVNRQLRAYNSWDIDAYCALFAARAVVSRLDTGQELARGIDAIGAYYTIRFKNPSLHCEVKSRIALGNFVIDHEQATGVGPGLVEVIAIYEVVDALIQSMRFIWPQPGE
jgi:hypothetical protein